MDYSLSPQFFTHSGTGQRMHKEDQGVPTAVTDSDLNSVIWSLMEIVKDSGLAGVQFDPNVPASYRVLLNAIKAIYAASTSDLPGRVAIFWRPTPPPGWIDIDGSLLSRTGYPALWSYVQSIGAVSDATWLAGNYGYFSAGDGSTTFRLPDIRSHFLRPADRSRGIDIGRQLFTVQAALLAAHGHGVNDPTHGHGVYDPGHLHGLNDPGHAHGVNDPVHTHGTTDPGHAHNSQYGVDTPTGLDTSNASGAEIATWGNSRTYPVTPSATGVTINGAHSGVTVNGAGTGASVAGAASNIGINGAGTGISIQSSGGVETRPLNMAVPFYMKF